MPHVIQSFLLDGRGRFATAARRYDVPATGHSGGCAGGIMGSPRRRLDGGTRPGVSHESVGQNTTMGRAYHPSLETDTALRACERLGKER